MPNQGNQSRERDSQRSKVYKAERAIWQAHRQPLPTVRDVERYVKRMFTMLRVRDAYPVATDTWQQLPEVRDGRGCRSARGGRNRITIPLWARDTFVVTHELAHTFCQREHGEKTAAHGWEYCSIYLKLVLYGMGRQAHDELKASFKAHKVRFTKPRKRQPLSPERRAQLAARLAATRVIRQPKPQRLEILEGLLNQVFGGN